MAPYVSFAKFASLLALALSGSVNASNVFDKRALPKDWTFHREAASHEPLVLEISLKEQDLDAFHQHVIDISTPGHEHYGNHLEGHEVADFIRPAAHSIDSVREWLEAFDITDIVHDNDWLHLRTTVGKANDLLGTSFKWYQNTESKEAHLRTLEYSVPGHIVEHINFVHPTVKFPSIRALRATHNKPKPGDFAALDRYMAWAKSVGDVSAVTPPDAVCNQTITPQCLFKLYNVHYGAKDNSKVAYASFLNEYARYTDLTLFEETQAMYAMGKNFSVVKFNGGQNDQTSTNDSTEANLDNQYILSVGYPLSVTEYSTAGCGPIVPDQLEAAGSCSNEPYLAFLSGILKLPNKHLPETLSLSYGEDEQTWPEALAKKVCSMFAQLGARGVSVMFASGDFGPGSICENNNGTAKKFTPEFPASCPFVTSVGGTQNVAPEMASSFAGGGFSDYFARPAYQNVVVPAYLKQLGSTFQGYYNPAGRGIPDVSAQSVDFLVVNQGATEPVSGTSAASPTFAAVISLLNSALISQGKKPLGFLNPFLYKKGRSGLTDITAGGSTGCSMGNMTIPNAGWNATTGWDPVTGLGTPNFGKLLKIVAPKVKNAGGPG